MREERPLLSRLCRRRLVEMLRVADMLHFQDMVSVIGAAEEHIGWTEMRCYHEGTTKEWSCLYITYTSPVHLEL
jgi:hypothetical protein